ncbi:MAG: hypothetical protein IT368_14380, partial [Candidatus Hydrogenedentes bacterium]|nr:hypothetical protein [Candidatus Hydrogenedentota bacterium]
MRRGHTIQLLMAAALLCSGYLPLSASAQRLIVITQTWSAVREAAAVYAQSLDLGMPGLLPGPVHLPGRALIGPPAIHPTGKQIYLTTGSGTAMSAATPESETWHSAVAVAPFHLAENAALPAPHGLRTRVALAIDQEAPAPAQLLLLGERPEANGGELLVCTEDGDLLRRLELPGKPVAAARLAAHDAAVLCDSADGPIVMRCDLSAQRLLPLWSEQRPPDALDSTPVALAVSADGRYLFVMTTGYSVSQGLTQPQSWVYVISIEDAASLGSAIALPGGATAESEALQASGSATAWALTSMPGTAFAQATQIRISEGVPQIQRAHSLADAGDHPLIATSPGGLATAAALGRRLEIWPLGARTGTFHEYPDPMQFIAWKPVGLFAAAGNRLYLVNPQTGAPDRHYDCQSGTVEALTLVPEIAYPLDDLDGDGLSGIQEQRLGTAPDQSDSDGDGIHDGIDPEPTTPSPRLDLPASILFRGDSAGRELRGLLLQPAHGENSVWQVHYDTANLPWLNLRPVTGQGWSPIFMGIDPARYAASGATGGWLQVSMQGTRAPFPAAGSPQSIRISAT